MLTHSFHRRRFGEREARLLWNVENGDNAAPLNEQVQKTLESHRLTPEQATKHAREVMSETNTKMREALRTSLQQMVDTFNKASAGQTPEQAKKSLEEATKALETFAASHPGYPRFRLEPAQGTQVRLVEATTAPPAQNPQPRSGELFTKTDFAEQAPQVRERLNGKLASIVQQGLLTQAQQKKALDLYDRPTVSAAAKVAITNFILNSNDDRVIAGAVAFFTLIDGESGRLAPLPAQQNDQNTAKLQKELAAKIPEIGSIPQGGLKLLNLGRLAEAERTVVLVGSASFGPPQRMTLPPRGNSITVDGITVSRTGQGIQITVAAGASVGERTLTIAGIDRKFTVGPKQDAA